MASRRENELKYLEAVRKHHKGRWLDREGVIKYQNIAKRICTMSGDLTGERRKICLQKMEEYGITEIEAINILNGHGAIDYIAKYERIRTGIP